MESYSTHYSQQLINGQNRNLDSRDNGRLHTSTPETSRDCGEKTKTILIVNYVIVASFNHYYDLSCFIIKSPT